MEGKTAEPVRLAGSGGPVEDIPVFTVKIIDAAGVEYQLDLSVIYKGLRGLAATLMTRHLAEATVAHGAVKARIVRTGTVYEMNNPLAVVRTRYRDGDQEGGGGSEHG